MAVDTLLRLPALKNSQQTVTQHLIKILMHVHQDLAMGDDHVQNL